MSRIYEALRNAEEMRARSELNSRGGLGLMEGIERRGSPRIDLDIDLTVYGRSAEDLPFYEHAKAISGNVNGGLFLLGVPVLEGQSLLLINNRTSSEQICSVVNVRVRDAQTTEVSVRFATSNMEFWQIPVAENQV